MLLTLTILATSLALTYAAPSHSPKELVTNPFDPANWPLPGPVTGDTQPWGGIHVHDPSIIKHGPSYFSFSTHELVAISRAPALRGPWTKLGSALPGPANVPVAGNNDTWAPDVIRIGELYHLYYSASTFGSQDSAIGLATSASLLPGTWTDHGQVLRTGPGLAAPYNISNGIDAFAFQDDDGEVVLGWGSIDTTQPAVHLAYEPMLPNPVEGGYLYKRGGWYYLFFSHGICCGYTRSTLPAPGTEYSIRVGRARSRSGPFVDRAGVALLDGGGSIVYGSHGYVYGPGGQGVFNDNGVDIMYYHYLDIRTANFTDESKLLGYNKILWIQDWPVLV